MIYYLNFILNFNQSRSNLRKKFLKLCKTSLPNEITKPTTIKTLNKYSLNESLICLDRSIYWLLNYYRNRDGYCLNSKIQNLYYSEFFMHLSISRFLGLAFTWISEINLPIKIQIEKINDDTTKSLENNMKMNVIIRPSMGGMHDTTFIQIRSHINQNIDLPDSSIAQWFKPSVLTSLMKDERVESVYDISLARNDPWYFAHHSVASEYNSYCFLDGRGKYFTNDLDADEYILKKYGDWGYKEDHIGTLIKWMIDRLKGLNAKRKIRQISKSIKNFDDGLYPDTLREPKSILLEWLS